MRARCPTWSRTTGSAPTPRVRTPLPTPSTAWTSSRGRRTTRSAARGRTPVTSSRPTPTTARRSTPTTAPSRGTPSGLTGTGRRPRPAPTAWSSGPAVGNLIGGTDLVGPRRDLGPRRPRRHRHRRRHRLQHDRGRLDRDRRQRHRRGGQPRRRGDRQRRHRHPRQLRRDRGGVSDGIDISGSGTMSNNVYGNFIGTDASGEDALGNGVHGVAITLGAEDNSVGLDDNGDPARDVISGNGPTASTSPRPGRTATRSRTTSSASTPSDEGRATTATA